MSDEANKTSALIRANLEDVRRVIANGMALTAIETQREAARNEIDTLIAELRRLREVEKAAILIVGKGAMVDDYRLGLSCDYCGTKEYDDHRAGCAFGMLQTALGGSDG